MKKITNLFLTACSFAFFAACTNDPIDSTNIDAETQVEVIEVIESLDVPTLPENWEVVLQDSLSSILDRLNFENKEQIGSYAIFDADRCADDANFKGSSFWWPEDVNTILFEEFYTNDQDYPITFTEYNDGTALIVGVSNAFRKDCKVLSYVWLENKRNYDQWTSFGGSFKDEGCSGAVGEDLNYYVINQENSYMVSLGSDCLGEGIYGFEQRPNPDNPATDNFGVAVGPGGALWDSSIGDLGLAGWAWITDIQTGERLWSSDFNFTLELDGAFEERICNVDDADRCSEENPNTNFWWPEDVDVINFDEFYDTDKSSDYTFTQYPDGTAHIVGSVLNINSDLTCAVDIDIWLKDRKSWLEWQADGGEFKDEGCSEAKAENMNYYVVDAERSFITTKGGDCYGEGKFTVSQRPSPSNPETPNFGFAVGPGGALWDSQPNQNGLAGWIFITCGATGEIWGADLNFIIGCTE